jgi:hypothetical protein
VENGPAVSRPRPSAGDDGGMDSPFWRILAVTGVLDILDTA